MKVYKVDRKWGENSISTFCVLASNIIKVAETAEAYVKKNYYSGNIVRIEFELEITAKQK